ncbi:MAG: 2-oxoacid:acceptor oxidoreductase family protein [Actinobacteria bacterium]|nr:2-oxoacid:acceptor oxidoreductase family protein [Actinomycetota bacterium]
MSEAPAMTDGLLSSRPYVEVRFGGSGGQGVILMGVILAVAGTRDRRHVVQTQSYGPEARGGYSRSDVVLANAPIDYPQIQGLDLLVALSAEAARKYAGSLRRDGFFIFDSDEITSPPPMDANSYGIPFTRLAVETTGRTQTTNILALGAVAGLTGVVSVASLEKAVLSMVPKGTEEMNLNALRRGLALLPEEWKRPSI